MERSSCRRAHSNHCSVIRSTTRSKNDVLRAVSCRPDAHHEPAPPLRADLRTSRFDGSRRAAGDRSAARRRTTDATLDDSSHGRQLAQWTTVAAVSLAGWRLSEVRRRRCSTRTALISPSIRLPSWNDAAAAETPSGAASSMPRPLTSDAVDHLDGLLVRRDGQQHGVVGGGHLGQDLARRGRGVCAEIAEVDREAGLRRARTVLQRVVEDHQVLDRERVVHRQLAGLGDAGDAPAGRVGVAVGQYLGADLRDFGRVIYHLPLAPPPTVRCDPWP